MSPVNFSPYLPRARVATTSARAYLELLDEGQP